MQYLRSIPPELVSLVESGAASVTGSLVKACGSGKILGHLQASQPLIKAVGAAVNPAAPLAAGSLAVTAVSSVVANFQLQGVSNKLAQVLEQLQRLRLIRSIGAAASVVNIGVSVAGFALVLKRLRRVESKIDALDAKVAVLASRSYKVDVITALERSEEAFFASPAHQQSVWREAEHRLHRGAKMFLLDASSASLDHPAQAAQATAEALFTSGRFTLDEAGAILDWLLAAARGRLEVLLLLGEVELAMRFASTLAQWLGSIHLDPVAISESKLGGALVSSPLRRELAWQVGAIADHTASQGVLLGEEAGTLRVLRDRGIDTGILIKEAIAYSEPELLYLPLSDNDV